jgi:hypothetical protein
MRRAGLSALLIVCLITFLCPDVAKPSVITVTQTPDCCSKVSGCKMTPEQTSQHDRRGGDKPQPGSCCTVSCSTLILFCPISDGFSTPRFNGRAFEIDDATPFARIERPPTPPPRI